MVVPQETSIASLANSFKSLQPSEKGQDMEKQKCLVVQAFRSLIAKCPLICLEPFSSSHEENLPGLFEQIELRAELLKRLQSGLLPSLRHRITALSLSLDPCDLRKNATGQLKQVLEILGELEQTLDQIKASVASIAPVLRPSLVSNDGHLKNLKAFRCVRVRLKVNDLAMLVSELFQTCVRFTENLTYSSSNEPRGRAEVLSLTSLSWNLIDTTIEWFDRSEFSLLQDQWQSEVGLVDDALDELTKLINHTGPEGESDSAANSSDEDGDHDHDDDDDDDDMSFGANDSRPSEHVIQLAKSAVPIIKLSRLFLNKLSKTTTQKEPFGLVTEMSSSQLESLLASTGSISRIVDEIVCTLSDADDDDHALATEDLIQSGNNLSEAFREIQLVLDRYLIPLISEEDSSSSSKVNIKTWFSEWNKQFLLATQNYIPNGNS
ncbi:hypothetical protein PGTUg99_022609 [Puccinia graminis f. sp. tritici]|uniref:Uncharacterized protein n=1 Tax=Puccinia graminis f. sp. tritici TaxID=56615 RepID=A0A5B0NH11_PUCGR|nr:hypothetical protein PGTUg99_022609 [Puccinia graminis f. sp. tritici]